jgi:beta-phosphoglucomutase
MVSKVTTNTRAKLTISDKPAALLFDLDGVLIDSQLIHWEAWDQFLRQHKPRLQMDHAQFISTFGMRNETAIRHLLPDATNDEIATWSELKEAIYRTLAGEKLQLLPGVEPFLKQIAEANIPRAIASSTPRANLTFLLKHTVLGSYFPIAVSGDEVPHGKPAPDVFLEAARRCNADPSSSIVFEDAPVGLAAGRSAGCFVVALSTTHPAESLQPRDFLIRNFTELPLERLIDAWNSALRQSR